MGYFLSLWNYLLASSPYLLFGFTLSGIIKTLLPKEKIEKWLGGNSIWSVVKASLVGIPLPLCSCSVIPMAVTLRKSGASRGATSAFLISTPESSIDSIMMTYALMDLPMTLMRPLAAFISATLAGIMQIFFNSADEIKDSGKKISNEIPNCCKTEVGENENEGKNKISFLKKLIEGLRYSFFDLMEDISFWLLLGILLGAFIDFIFPPNFFDSFSLLGSKLVILAIGIPLYVCASATTPIAAALIMKGMAPGTALILLLVGPATNISNLVILKKYLGTRGVVMNTLSIAIVALLFSFFADWLYQENPIELSLKSIHQHEQHSDIWHFLSISATIVFLIFLLRGFYYEHLKHWTKKIGKNK